jgi:hypothetical protein
LELQASVGKQTSERKDASDDEEVGAPESGVLHDKSCIHQVILGDDVSVPPQWGESEIDSRKRADAFALRVGRAADHATQAAAAHANRAGAPSAPSDVATGDPSFVCALEHHREEHGSEAWGQPAGLQSSSNAKSQSVLPASAKGCKKSKPSPPATPLQDAVAQPRGATRAPKAADFAHDKKKPKEESRERWLSGEGADSSSQGSARHAREVARVKYIKRQKAELQKLKETRQTKREERRKEKAEKAKKEEDAKKPKEEITDSVRMEAFTLLLRCSLQSWNPWNKFSPSSISAASFDFRIKRSYWWWGIKRSVTSADAFSITSAVSISCKS